MVASIKSKILLSAGLSIGLCLAQVGPTGGGGGGSVGPRGAAGATGPAPAGTGTVVVNNGVPSTVAVSGDGALNPATGALTVTKSNGVAIADTSSTQTLTNKTVDGVSPATMAFLDATSSVQTQLNGKEGNPGTCAIVATGGTLTLNEASCTNGGTGGTATATGAAPFANFEINGGNQAAITVSINGWTQRNHSLRATQGGSTVTTWTWPGAFSPAPSVYPAVGQSVSATGYYDGSTYFVFLGSSTSGVGFGAEVTAPTCSSGVLPPAGYYLAWADSTDHTIHYYSSTCVKSSYVNVLSGAANTFVTGLGANGGLTTQAISGTAPIALSGAGAISLSGVTSEQGNGLKVQLSTGTTTTNDCVKFDGNGNTVDAGAACGSGGGGAGTPGSTYFTYVNAAGVGPSNTASETSLIGGATTGSKTIPANTLTAGAYTQFNLVGQITAPAVPDNLTLNMYMGATKVATGTITGTNIANLTTQTFKIAASLYTLTGGATCAFVTEDASMVSGASAGGSLVKLQGTGTTFDCTATQAFDFKAQWAGAQSGESIFGQGVSLLTPGAPITSVNGATGAAVITVSGTPNQVDITGGAGTTPTAKLSSTAIMPGSLTVLAANGSYVNQPFAPVYNLADATDQLTGNGAVQWFGLGSGQPQIPAAQFANGKRIAINFLVDVITGGTQSASVLKPSLCTVSGCGSGSQFAMAATTVGQNPGCAINTTCAEVIRVVCVAPQASGGTQTILCGPDGGRMFGQTSTTISGIIANVPTNGVLYLNLSYNQAASAGNKISMLGAWATWDTP